MTRDADLPNLFAKLFQAHPWHGIPPRDAVGRATGYIEIVPSDPVKYELDKPSGHLKIDRPQRYSNLCPALYGFVPQTYCGRRVGERAKARTGLDVVDGDGDPLDICVLSERAFSHGGFLASVEIIGGLRMIDAARADDKLIAVLVDDVAFGAFRELGDCPAGIVDRLRHYFLTYKLGPGGAQNPVQIAEVYDRAEALRVLDDSIADYRDKFGAPDGRWDELARALSRG